MASRRQLEANRANSRRSTGPRTSAGRHRSKRNALKHGLCARTILIGDERPEQFEELRAAVIAHFRPCSLLAHDAADRYAATLWRLRRIPAIEAALAKAARQQAYMEECRALKRAHYSEIYGEAYQACETVFDSDIDVFNARVTGQHQARTAEVFNELSAERSFRAPGLEPISPARTMLFLIETCIPFDVIGRLNRYETALMKVASRQREELERYSL